MNVNGEPIKNHVQKILELTVSSPNHFALMTRRITHVIAEIKKWLELVVRNSHHTVILRLSKSTTNSKLFEQIVKKQ
jgi:hypothetical protein